MRLASFYLLSITLHAMVLVYPVTFNAHDQGETFRVTIDYSAREGGAGEDGTPGKKSNPHSNRTPTAVVATRGAKTVNNTPEPQTVSARKLETVNDSPISLLSSITPSSEPEADSLSSTKGNGEDSASAGAGMDGRGNGNGRGSSSGSGNGAASGSGGSGSGAASLTQARYRDTPRPEYPDDARRQGHEGRVLLRVFVDQQGEPKTVEVSRSSGSNALDMAATKAIKRWRFHPARKGDRPVDSWVNVPVDFHLTDPKN